MHTIDHLTPVHPSVEKSLSACKRVRWMGSDGGFRVGKYVLAITNNLDLMFDEARGETVLLASGNWADDLDKDNNGNPTGAK